MVRPLEHPVQRLRRSARRVREALPLKEILSVIVALLALFGEHKARDWKDAAENAQTVKQRLADRRSDSLAFLRVNARVDTVARDVRVIKHHQHLSPAEIAREAAGPTEPPPHRGGIIGFLGRFFGNGQ